MTTDHDLDARLLAARGVRDADLPALPDAFLDHLHTVGTEQPESAVAPRPIPAAAAVPASVLAAQQLVADARERHGSGAARRGRPGRRTVLRSGVAMLAVAAAWTVAVLVASPDGGRPPADRAPSDGITLVATEEITFPLSLDPTPAGMTPTFTGDVHRADAVADYRSADGLDRFTVYVAPVNPATADRFGEPYAVTETGTVTIDGAEAEFVRGTIVGLCDQSGCRDRPFVDLLWERAAGQWVWLQGEGAYGDVAAAVGVGESLVDRPQPINLQVGLAPAGWSVIDWHESSGGITLAADGDPGQVLGVQVLPPGSGGSVEQRIDSVTAIAPAVPVTVAGRPGRLVNAHDYMDAELRFWLLAWQLPDGSLATVTAPAEFAADDVVAIAEQVTYTP
jgi:hypothetical protein